MSVICGVSQTSKMLKKVTLARQARQGYRKVRELQYDNSLSHCYSYNGHAQKSIKVSRGVKVV